MESTQTDVLINLRADRLFAKWIGRLKLTDWEIRWKIVHGDQLPSDRSGSCDSSLMKKIASLKILHPDDADPGWLDPYDFEVTIVHELLHLHLAPWALLFEEGDQANLLLEQTVHLLSSTFVAADRHNEHWENFSEICSVQDTSCVVR